MSSGRPMGSKNRNPTTAYQKRTRRMKRMYGEDIYKKWGKKGGNPVLLKQGKEKARRAKNEVKKESKR